MLARLAALLLLCPLLSACSRTTTPALPALVPDEPPAATLPQILPLDAQTGTGLLFLMQGEAALDGTAILAPVPVRAVNALGDAFTVDLTSILGDGAPCGDCIRITEIGVDGTRIELTLALRHPFPLGPLPGQGTPKTRNDLHVFDVRGYMAPQSGGPVPVPVPGIGLDLTGDGTKESNAQVLAGHLLNPAGYGVEYKLFAEPFLGPVSGNIHPFRDYFWDPVPGSFAPGNPNGFADVRLPSGQNVFRQGTTFTDPGAQQTFRLQTVNGKVNFFFMVTCAYGASSTFPLSAQNPNQLGSRANPKYFLPAFHRAEAARVSAQLSQALGAQDPNSEAQLTVSVIDWQGTRTAKNASLVLGDPPDTLAWPGSVAQVEVAIPGVLNGVLSRTAPDTGDGSAANPFIYQFTIVNQQSAATGIYPGLLAVRDALSQREPATPAGVYRDLAPLNIREYTTFQGLLVQVGPATAGTYAPDPVRTNVNLIASHFTSRTGADVELDLAVVHQGDPTADGVYMPATGNNGLVRYSLDYTTSVTAAPAITPLYTPNVVPDPGNPPPGFDPARRMPITHLDLGWDATGFATGTDDFPSMRFSHSEDPPGTQSGERTLTSSMLLYNYYRSTNPPSGVGPVLWFEDLTSSNTGQPFAFLPGVYNDNPGTPENEFLLSLAEAPIPVDVFEAGNAGDGDSYYGAVWRNSQDAANGNRPFQVLRVRGVVPGSTRGLNATGWINQLNFTLPEFSAIHLVAADMLWLGNGTLEVWLAFATNHIVAIRWPGAAGLPGTSPEGAPRANIVLAAGLPVDIEILPFNPAQPRTINGQTQGSPVLVVLTDSGTIEVLNNVYASTPTLMQSLNLNALGVQGTPQHLDLDWETWDIHLTTRDGGTPRVTVFSLQ